MSLNYLGSDPKTKLAYEQEKARQKDAAFQRRLQRQQMRLAKENGSFDRTFRNRQLNEEKIQGTYDRGSAWNPDLNLNRTFHKDEMQFRNRELDVDKELYLKRLGLLDRGQGLKELAWAHGSGEDMGALDNKTIADRLQGLKMHNGNSFNNPNANRQSDAENAPKRTYSPPRYVC